MRQGWMRGRAVLAGGLATCLAGGAPASAQDAARIDSIERQMRALQNELQRLRRDAEARAAQTRAAQQDAERARAEAQEAQRRAAAVPTAAPPAPPPADTVRLGFPNSRPTITSPDGRFAVGVGARFQYDVGGYIRGERDAPDNRGVPNLNDFGQNLRRGRVYLTARYDDFLVNVTPEFGGSPDGVATLYEANFNYSPVRPLTLTLGYFKPLFTLAEATSSADLLFLERPAITVIGSGISAGSSRSVVGGRWSTDKFYAAAYLTGNTVGANSTTQGTPDQTGGVARFAGRPFRTADFDFHLGISGTTAFDIRRTTANNAFGSTPTTTQSLTLNDRPGELRIDNAARLINTGSIPADSAYTWAPEIAFRWRNFFVQGEYVRINLDQSEARGQLRPGLEFEGGYVEGSWVMTGETRRYSTSNASFARPNPSRPFSLREGTWGAWELTGRYSVADLNSNVTRGRSQASTGGVFGGRQELFGVGLSWYPNNILRFMLAYNIVNVDRLNSSGTTQIGQRFHDIGLRSQISF